MSGPHRFDVPRNEQLPSTRQLRYATIAAIAIAFAIYYVAVLPAEKGVDPTGVGRKIGLEDMGLWKVDLAKEMAEAEVFRAQRLAADSAASKPK